MISRLAKTMTELNIVKGSYYSGTSGIVVPQPNKQLYPEEFRDKSRLEYYSSLFNSIEINSSFYKLPMAKTVAKWAQSVPDDFRFTFKLWREITHVKELAFKNEDVDRFMNVITEAGSKKGTLLVQFPPSLQFRHAAQVFQLLGSIAKADQQQEWKIALEFRNETWYTDEANRFLQATDSGLVVHDKLSAANTFGRIDTDFVYLRLHGYNGDYKGSYEDDFLYEYAQYVNDFRLEGKDVFVYFNNTRGDAVHNLITLDNYVKGEKFTG
jgi:uncharacterized protein YecE (DUF72 family)